MITLRQRNHGLLIASVLAAAVWATAAFGQIPGQGSGVGQVKEAPGKAKRDEKLDKDLGSSDRALERALKNLDRLPKGLRNDLTTLQDSLSELRSAWEAEYAPSEDASEEEILDARQRFEDEMSAKIKESRELRKKVVTTLRDDLRDQVQQEDWSPEDRAKFESYEQSKLELEEAWREARAALGPNATGKEIREAKSRFLDENKAAIEQQRQLAAEIRAMVGAGKGQSPAAGREQLPEALQALRADMQLARDALREQKRQAREELKGLGPEQREQRREQILEELRDAHDQIKESRRRLIEDLRDESDGDRRAED